MRRERTEASQVVRLYSASTDEKSTGDVTAVGMEISPSAIDFYYAKNEPCEPSVGVYVDTIGGITRDNEPNAIPRLMLTRVMVECADKIRARVKKCHIALEDCGEIPSVSPGNFYADRLHKWSGQDDSKVLQSFYKELRLFDTSIADLRSQPARSMAISQKACIIGTITLRILTRMTGVSNSVIGIGEEFVPHPTLLRRIHKLGAYFAAAIEIRVLLERNPEYRKLAPILTSPRLKLYFILLPLLPPPNVAYNQRIINDSSQAKPPAQPTAEIPKNICILLEKNAKRQTRSRSWQRI